METKRTPGEWATELVGSSSAGPDGHAVYEITNGHVRIAECVAERDADLISAAPDLLDALQLLLREEESGTVCEIDRQTARAAIAKATGAA